nr:hypothetical protein [Tanacetum cinerariifolium]
PLAISRLLLDLPFFPKEMGHRNDDV